MGMLNEARKDKSKAASDKENLKPDHMRKHKKHAQPSTEIPGNKPGVETAADASDSDDQPEASEPGGGSGTGTDDSAASSPQQPQGAPDAEQGEQEDDSQDGGAQAPQGESDDESDQDQSQGGAPSGDAGGNDGSAPQPGQAASPNQDDDAQTGPTGQGGPIDLSQIPISPALKEEFTRCNAALYTALYTNDKVANAVMNGIVPSGPHKIESVARMSLLLFTQINKQLHFVKDTPQVVLPFARDIADHVLDLATTVKKVQFTDQEAQAAIGALLELVQRVVGVTKGNLKALRHIIPRSQLQDAHSKYQQHLQYIKGARGSDQSAGAPQSPGNPGGTPQPGQPDQSQGEPPEAQPPAQGQPQQGAPVTAAPGPGQSAPPGGMLSQAANQPPQGG